MFSSLSPPSLAKQLVRIRGANGSVLVENSPGPVWHQGLGLPWRGFLRRGLGLGSLGAHSLVMGLLMGSLLVGCGSDESIRLSTAGESQPNAQQDSQAADEADGAEDGAADSNDTSSSGADATTQTELDDTPPFDYSSVDRPLPALEVEEILAQRANESVDWESCAALTERGDDDPALEPFLEAGLELVAECARSESPLYYEAPERGQFQLFVKRLATERAQGDQLWLLNGGPGFSGRSLEDFALLVLEQLPELSVYIPDHRGTGRSVLFECLDTFGDGADVTTELPSCGNELRDVYGEDTQAFRTTEAAMDVVDLMSRLTEPDARVMLHGGSYGGYWLHRVLQLAPGLVDAAVFESSIKSLGRVDALEVGNAPVEAAKRLFELCASHEECRRRLGDEPYAKAAEILDGFEEACPELVDAGWSRLVLQSAATIALDYAPYRDLLPALFSRLERCEERDVEWIAGYFEYVLTGGGLETLPPTREAPSSRAMFFHITLSELIARALPRSALQAASFENVFTSAFRNLPLNDALGTWPVYSKDAYWGELAETDAPILVLHGELDARTPPSEGRFLAQQFSASGQNWVLVPGAGHGVVQTSRLLSSGLSCGAQLLVEFLDDPSAALDTSCTQQSVIPDFSSGGDRVEQFAPGQGVWD